MAPPLKTKERLPDVSDKSSTEFSFGGKTMVILAKPSDKDKTSQSQSHAESSSSTSSVQHELKPPTVLLKSRDNVEQDGSRAASPGTVTSPHASQSASSSAKDSESFADFVKNVSQKFYQIHQKPSASAQSSDAASEQKLAPPPEMTSPVKLVDESLQWCDNALEFLHDATDFYVVGVLGLQGTGKSTVMSTLNGWSVFKSQNSEQIEVGEHCTMGIDMFVTNQRLILLDTQPVLSASVMDRMIQYEKKPLGAPDYHSAENSLHMQSLQQAAFLLAVCHTIITVQDWFIDLNYLRFLLSAEMLKPSTPINPHDLNPMPEGTTEYYPHIVFVQNKCQNQEFSPNIIREMQQTLFNIFQRSNLKFSGNVHNNLLRQPRSEDFHKINLFLLPEKEKEEANGLENDDFPEYRGHPGFQQLAESFSHQILSMPRTLLTHTALTEKNWFHYSARIWETVKKSNLFHEYNRLLP